RFAPSKAIRLPADEGLRPSPSIITPAFTSSSLNFPIASNIAVISAVGSSPRSLSSVAFTNTITRIGLLLGHRPAWPSCGTTKQGQRNRQGRGIFRPSAAIPSPVPRVGHPTRPPRPFRRGRCVPSGTGHARPRGACAMAFVSSLRYEDELSLAQKKRVVEGIQRLRQCFRDQGEPPLRTMDDSVVIATWNRREFGKPEVGT